MTSKIHICNNCDHIVFETQMSCILRTDNNMAYSCWLMQGMVILTIKIIGII